MLVVWNLRLYVPAHHDGAGSANVELQLRFLRRAVDAGAAHDAQRVFPEGFVFTWVLYGLAQAERGLSLPAAGAARADALAEARRALVALDSSDATEMFDAGLVPRYGAFYAGWTTWLRAQVVLMAGDGATAEERRRLAADARAVAAAFDASASPFLPSYPGQAWPADAVVCMVALRAHDRALIPAFDATIASWTRKLRSHVDPRTGLLPHVYDAATGAPLEGPRGSSAALMAAMLPSLDEALAREQYRLFRRWFVVSRLGLPGVREYLPGVPGAGDDDSGPLLLGLSLSASAVGIAAARANGDAHLADALAGAAAFVGETPARPGERQYLLGLVPIADAFLAWAAATPMPAPATATAAAPAVPGRCWRLPVHLGSLFAALWPWRRRIKGWPRHV
jgi:hypothetical protein